MKMTRMRHVVIAGLLMVSGPAFADGETPSATPGPIADYSTSPATPNERGFIRASAVVGDPAHEPLTPDLPAMIRLIGLSPLRTAQFIAALPTIADNCGLKWSLPETQITFGRFTDHFNIGGLFRAMAKGTLKNDVLAVWHEDHEAEPDRFCHAAVNLWGPDGAQFSGLLEEK